MEWIPPSTMGAHLGALTERRCPGPIHLHKKWHDQVSATVEKLHRHGIVWGDMNPCNIAIDDALNAWVIGFGGLNNHEFVDDAKMETSEGDWQRAKRMFKEWRTNRQVERLRL